MHYRYQYQDQLYEIELERHGSQVQAVINGQPYRAEILDEEPGKISLRIGSRPVTLHWAADGGTKWVSLGGCTYRLEKPARRAARLSGERSAEDSLRAPMPAQVRSVDVMPGETVEKGQTVLLLEAMKMEIRLRAPRAGRIARLLVKENDPVERDQVLVELE